jgi:xylan 1,4-beta-xylosidase
MWSGSDEDYFRLYRVTARRIKDRFPHLKVGGPAVGFSGSFQSGKFVASDFVTHFLALCRGESLPLDFFSWHCYTADPAELTARARAIRQLLDANGLATTESYLNEWNYLAGDSWKAFSKSATPQVREEFYQKMSGAESAAFVAAALIELQDAPIDVCNFYHGELGGFGLFNEQGRPNHVYSAIRAFSKLASLGCRVRVEGGVAGKLALLAARSEDQSRAAMLISNFRFGEKVFELNFAGVRQPLQYRISLVDDRQVWAEVARGTLNANRNTFRLPLPSVGVALVEFEKVL